MMMTYHHHRSPNPSPYPVFDSFNGNCDVNVKKKDGDTSFFFLLGPYLSLPVHTDDA